MSYGIKIERDESVTIQEIPTSSIDLTLAFRIAKIHAGWESRTAGAPILDRLDISPLANNPSARTAHAR